MHKYLIIIEKTATGFSSCSPDLPGCVSTGETREEIERNMKEAIEFPLEGMQEEGYPIPQPSAESAYLKVAS